MKDECANGCGDDSDVNGNERVDGDGDDGCRD